jgi:hypothetical protein
MRRKQVVKNLPRRKESIGETSKPPQPPKGWANKGNNLEVQKYYRTELLSADEEYALGLKVQLMVKCEQVHEGLAAEVMRLPTIEEWAAACGYVAKIFPILQPSMHVAHLDFAVGMIRRIRTLPPRRAWSRFVQRGMSPCLKRLIRTCLLGTVWLKMLDLVEAEDV